MSKEFGSFDPEIVKKAEDYFDKLPPLSYSEDERMQRIVSDALDRVTGREPGTTDKLFNLDSALGTNANNLVLKNGPLPEDYPLPGDTNYPQRQN